MQSATGSGKTMTFCHILKHEAGASVAIAHRSELVTQMSLTLARYGVRHRVIGPNAVARQCAALHLAEIGRDYTDSRSKTAVAGVQSLIRLPQTDPWFKQVTLFVGDEAHHFLRDNSFGQAASMFPNARGLYPTATPCRSDKKGLGRHADGLIDAMVLGPSMRWLIENGFLTDYRVFAPKSDIDISKVAISQSTGDFNLTQLRSAVHESRQIVGDVVKHYLRIAPGKLGATFCVDVEEATKVAAAYRAAGVPAEVITGNTPPLLRAELMRRFRTRDILQLVSVDILGEGVDVPAIEVVSMARHTASFGLFTQQFGRSLRPMEGKSHAIIIDHVGNFVRHGPPDAPQNWTLDRGERRRSSATDAESVRVCDNIDCLAAYPRRLTHCPYCEQPPTVAGRSAPDYVDGDLHELDASVLAHLRGEIERIDGAATLPLHLDAKIQRAVFNRHAEKQEAQRALRQTMALWGGYWVTQGETVRVAQKRFYLTWGIDVMTAQTLGVKDATALRERIVTWLNEQGVRT